MEEPTEGALLERARQGDHDAFSILVERHKDALVNYLTHLCRDHGRAEEIAQDAFVRLYRAGGRYQDREVLGPLLFRIATNTFRSEERRSRRWARLLMLVSTDEPQFESPQKVLLQDEICNLVSDALASLPLPYRAALVLREIEGWSHQEIGEALGCRIGTVKSRIARGRELLRQILSPYWNGVNHGTEPREAVAVAATHQRIS